MPIANDSYLFDIGREFRTFKEFSQPNGTQIAVGATYVVRATVPSNIELTALSLELDNGFVRTRTVAGGTAGGAFSENLPLIPRNTMTTRPTPVYTPKILLTAGGTHSGDGTLLDVLRVKVENSSGAAATVGAAQADARGVGPGTYYFLFQNVGTGVAEGVFHAEWAELG